MEIMLPSNVAVGELQSGFLGMGNKKKQADRKLRRAQKAEEKGKIAKAERLKRKALRKGMTKVERKADRKKRREERRAKRKSGKALTAEELAQEQLDMEEASEDGEASEATETEREAKSSEDNDLEGDEGFPTWAKWTIGITAGVGILGLATWGIVSAMKKKA